MKAGRQTRWRTSRRARRGVVPLLLGAAALGLAGGAVAATPKKDAAAKEPKVTAQAAVVMDARTGELLWSRNPDQQRAPASTTKILTTVLALESGHLDDVVRVSSHAQAQVPSKLYLRVGQTAKLRDLLYALMLKSANDAAVVVAEGVDGSVARFAQRMNEWARSAGARSSQFRNPSGLPDSQHLSTARDLGLILRQAVRVPGFAQVAGTTSQRISVTNGKKQQWIRLQTKNRLLQGYPVPVIGKTGFTRAAGRCFAGYAEKDGRALIVVVLGASDMWGDTRRLFDWGFRQEEDDLPVPVQVASRTKSGGKPPAFVSHAPVPPPVAKRQETVAKRQEAVAAERVAATRVIEPPPAKRAEPPPVVAVALTTADPPAPAKPRPVEADSKRPPAATVAAPRRAPSGAPEPLARVTLAMGTGSSTRSGVTYYDEYPSRRGMVRRGCTGAGCERRR